MGDEIGGGGGGGDDVVGLEVGRSVGAFVVDGRCVLGAFVMGGGAVGSQTLGGEYAGGIVFDPLSSEDESRIPGGGG